MVAEAISLVSGLTHIHWCSREWRSLRRATRVLARSRKKVWHVRMVVRITSELEGLQAMRGPRASWSGCKGRRGAQAWLWISPGLCRRHVVPPRRCGNLGEADSWLRSSRYRTPYAELSSAQVALVRKLEKASSHSRKTVPRQHI